MASYSQNASNKEKPWPEYFLVRTTGEVVPLVAVDELPVGYDIVGVPRSLDLKGTIGMLNLGLQRGSGAFYEIAQPEGKKTATAELPLRTKVSEPASAPKEVEVKLPTPGRSPPRSTSAELTSAPSKYATCIGTPRPANQACRHWCTHGICKWGQRCRYRHIMPMTLPGLQDIGLNDWPAWYRSLNPGYFATEALHQRPRINTPGRLDVCSGNGCCGGGLGPSARVHIGHLKAERLRAAGRELRSGRQDKAEEMLARLAGLSKPKEKGLEGKMGLLSRSVISERAGVEDVKDWEGDEDEGSETDDVNAGKEKKIVVKGSLLD